MYPFRSHILHGRRSYGESNAFQFNIVTKRNTYYFVEPVIEIDRGFDILSSVIDIGKLLANPIKSKIDDKLRIIGELICSKRCRQKEPAVIILFKLVRIYDMFFGLTPESGVRYLNDFLSGYCCEQASQKSRRNLKDIIVAKTYQGLLRVFLLYVKFLLLD